MIQFKGCSRFFLLGLLMIVLPLSLIAQSHKVARVILDGGNKYTNSSFIKVSFDLVNPSTKGFIDQMQLSENPDFSGARWLDFSMEGVSYQFNGGDGLKKLYLRFKDKAGNVSPADVGTIVLDRAAPKGKIVINDGSEFTNDVQGRVILSVESNENAKLFIANHASPENTQPIALEQTMRWKLDDDGDGLKKVYAILEDRAGNRSDLLEASIRLDREAPRNGQILINDQEEVTNQTEVLLKIKALDVEMIRVVDHQVAEVMRFQPGLDGFMEVPWTLKGEDGIKKIGVFFMDKAKNRTREAVTAEIKLDRQGPEINSFKINNGQRYVSNPKGNVELSVVVEDKNRVKYMEVSNDADFTVSEKFPYQTTIPWEIDASEDGLKTVYLRLADQIGNISTVNQAKIFLKRTEPKGLGIQVANGKEFIAEQATFVRLKAKDARFMQISENASFTDAEWQDYAEQLNLKLSDGDGKKVIYARFKDEVGNVSEALSTEVLLDSKPPVGKLIVNDGEPYVTAKDRVTALTIEAGEDAYAMRVSNSVDFTKAPWRPFQTEIRPWTLAGEDGLKMVYLQLADRAGNKSEVITASVTLDRTKPTKVLFRLNDGQKWHTGDNLNVKVSLEVQGANEMMIANDEHFAGGEWQPYQTEFMHKIEPGDGMKMVYAKFRNKAKIETDPVRARIMLDTTPPKIISGEVNDGNYYVTARDRRVPVAVKAEGAAFMRISAQALDHQALEDRSKWQKYEGLVAWLLEDREGEQEVFVYTRDFAGNISAPWSGKVNFHTSPVEVVSFKINNGTKYTNAMDQVVELNFNVNGASEMMLSNWEHFSNAKWQPYQANVDFKLDGNDGVKSVFAKFRNEAGVESAPSYGRVILDREPPVQCKIRINNDSSFTTHAKRLVKVQLKAMGAKYMVLSEKKDFSNVQWQPYKSFMSYQFSDPDGEKVLYAKFKDEPGNESAIVSASIISDVTPPKGLDFVINDGAKYTNDSGKEVILKIKADKARQMMIDFSPSFARGKWEPYQETKSVQLPGEDGEKVVYIKFRDEAGNESKLMTTRIMLKRSFN